MNSKANEEIALERIIREYFGVVVEVRQKIATNIPVSSNGAAATLFLTGKKQLFLYVNGHNEMTLGDIRKIVAHIGLKPEIFIPPKGRPRYFDEIGLAKFSEVFPGRRFTTGDDISFYRTLAPYNPALVLIAEIKDGYIYQYNSSVKNNWQPIVKFSYKRIKTNFS